MCCASAGHVIQIVMYNCKCVSTHLKGMQLSCGQRKKVGPLQGNSHRLHCSNMVVCIPTARVIGKGIIRGTVKMMLSAAVIHLQSAVPYRLCKPYSTVGMQAVNLNTVLPQPQQAGGDCSRYRQ